MTATVICALEDLVDGSGQRFDVDGHRLAVVRLGDDVYVIGDECSHQDFSLADGEVDADTCHIECFKHGSEFSLTTGEPDVLPATRAVPVYEARVHDGQVHVVLEAGGSSDE